MDNQQKILKDGLIELLRKFSGRHGDKHGEDVENLANQLIQIIYEGQGNDFGIMQIDTVKGLEPFIFSLIDELTIEKKNPAQLTVERMRSIQKLLLEFSVKPSKDEKDLVKTIESMENMLETEEVDVQALSDVLTKLNQQLISQPDSEASQKIFKSFVNRVDADLTGMTAVSFNEFVSDFTKQLNTTHGTINLEEIANYLRSHEPSLFGPSEKELKKKYDRAAQTAIANALKNNGF